MVVTFPGPATDERVLWPFSPWAGYSLEIRSLDCLVTLLSDGLTVIILTFIWLFLIVMGRQFVQLYLKRKARLI